MVFMKAAVVLLFLAGLLGACAEQPVSTRPAAGSDDETGGPCTTTGMDFARAYGSVDHVSGAFAAPVDEMNAFLMDGRGGTGPKIVEPPPIESRPADENVWLCYYDGDFYNFAKGPPPGVDGKTAEWKVVRLSLRVYTDGTADLDSAQTSQAAEPTGPSS